MEEILASIRAIIADDRANAAAARGADPSERLTPAGGSQVIYSTFGQKASGMPPPIPARPEKTSPAALPAPTPEPDFSPDEEPDAPLLSAEADREIATSFQALSASLTAPDPQKIEAMTRDLLRSMLKSWLDENLPALVERLVKAEIQRVARGGR